MSRHNQQYLWFFQPHCHQFIYSYYVSTPMRLRLGSLMLLLLYVVWLRFLSAIRHPLSQKGVVCCMVFSQVIYGHFMVITQNYLIRSAFWLRTVWPPTYFHASLAKHPTKNQTQPKQKSPCMTWTMEIIMEDRTWTCTDDNTSWAWANPTI